MESKKFDFIIIGAGLIGLSTAYHLKLKYPKKTLLILEKEGQVATHQSGHNSGVIHSGIYYKPGSLKATNCIAGYKSLVDFAEKHNISYDICGKIIVATSESEILTLNNIFNRGIQNGLTNLKKLNPTEIKEYEPHVAGVAGIHVPQTGIIDYPAVSRKLQDIICNELEGEITFNETAQKIIPGEGGHFIETNSSSYFAGKIVSCAGLQSDRVADLTEETNNLRIIPFRGEYYKIRSEKEYLVKNLIYPVPDPKFPFLGVHFTRMINGGIEAGPNAVLAFKREGYQFKDFDSKDVLDTITWPGFWRVVAKFGKVGIGEMHRSISKSAFTKALQKLLPEITEDDLVVGGAGVRAQACNRQGILIDDFDILESNNIIHVRNAPSPAATSCLSIGKLICEKI